MNGSLSARLDEFVAQHEAELIEFRRALHQHPELSYREFATTQRVRDRLEAAGLSSTLMEAGTGLWCDVDLGASGPTVALRADLDALAMPDEKSVPYASTIAGVAHACGHDVHTTIVMAAGLALDELRRSGEVDRGRVRLIFEPGEETIPGGAVDAIVEGAIDGVGSIIGIHCDPKTDVGTVGVRRGPITSAADSMTIMLHGPGGHTARPERTVDLVRVAAHVVDSLPGMLNKSLAAPLTVVFGAIHGGDASNVIPTTVELRGTLRTPSTAAWDALSDALVASVERLVSGTGATAEVLHAPGVPPVVNDDDVLDSVIAAATDVVGPTGVGEAEHSRGGDSFAWFARSIPAAYVRLGTHDPDLAGPRLDIHSGRFDVDERSIGIGVALLVQAALRELRRLDR